MKSLEELTELYETQLKPQLLSMEQLRKSIFIRFILSFLGILAAIFVAAALSQGNMAIIIAAVALIIACIVVIVKTAKMERQYRTQFKQNVVGEIVKQIDPGWNYEPNYYMPQDDYRSSGLFRQKVDRYKGDDMVYGVVDKTDFRMSELHTEYKTITVDDKGKAKETWHTIFKGLFAHADFNKELKGQTYVLPDTAERIFGKWGQKLQRGNVHGDLVKLENPEFEKLFVVYGSDQIEARYILTPGMMEAMVDIRKRYDREMYFSFVGSRVYVAMSFSKNLFEPRIIRSGVRFKDVKQMYYQFSLVTAIIDEMNLNTRIWTKD
ncbi:DUF3137 domain-containing protein [Puteibacter caeruleilacunae]|nr:DUF3137 domain-containing protein [Puteibacter caeruleilacunae]